MVLMAVPDMNLDDLQNALGGVVLEAAYMERMLRASFSALVGSKYAAVVDGRLAAAALIDHCEHIARYHTEIAEPARATLLRALRVCREVSHERNRVIHDAWATRPGSYMVTLRGDGSTRQVTVTVRTPAEVRQLADRVSHAADELGDAMTAALGPDWAHVEDELSQELGHDITTDPGR
jgi:hypothetical protein